MFYDDDGETRYVTVDRAKRYIAAHDHSTRRHSMDKLTIFDCNGLVGGDLTVHIMTANEPCGDNSRDTIDFDEMRLLLGY